MHSSRLFLFNLYSTFCSWHLFFFIGIHIHLKVQNIHHIVIVIPSFKRQQKKGQKNKTLKLQLVE